MKDHLRRGFFLLAIGLIFASAVAAQVREGGRRSSKQATSRAGDLSTMRMRVQTSGAVATVQAEAPGTYSCSFMATPIVHAMPNAGG